VSVGGARPVRLACVLQKSSVLIPTGLDADLVADDAAGQDVTIDFEETSGGRQLWRVCAAGVARPLGRRDRPRAADTVTALTMAYAFENGIRVGVDEMTGWVPAEGVRAPA
jgi:hypothetical protein